MHEADLPLSETPVAGLAAASKGATLTLRARTVLPMQGPPLDGGWLRLVRGRIVAVGRREPPGRVVDLGDTLLLPGLVNPHCHLEFSAIPTPLVPQQPPGGLAGWIPAVMKARQQPGHSDVAAAIRVGLRESAAAGVTLIGEIATADPSCSYPQQGVPRLRVYRECLGLSGARARGSLTSLRRGLDRMPSRAAGISPHAPYSVRASLAAELLRIAARRRLPVAVHLAESREEQELIQTHGGAFRQLLDGLAAWPSPAPRLLTAADWVSLACRAPRAAFIHASFLDHTAFARLARHRNRAAVVVCPRTAALISGRLAPVRQLLDAGIRVAIGTDGRGSAPDLSPRHEAAWLVDRGLVSPAEALVMLTTSAAWAVGCEHAAGRLIPGRPADLTILAPECVSADPYADVLAPSTRVVATLRSSEPIFFSA